ncbi:MAG TPA: lytic transglycosylase domain-containing protein [Cytophagaceae bacterium]
MEFISDYEARHQKRITRIPDDLSFAGEPVHFKSADAYQKFYRELKLNTANNASTRLLLSNARIWLPQISQILQAHKLPEDFVYVVVAESNLSNAVSPKGAAGFWQLTAVTASELGLEVNDEVDERYHPIKATYAACKYFKRSYKIFGNWTATAASYNRGMNGLQRAFRNQSVNSYYDLALNDETSRYIYRILALKDLIKNPEKYGLKKVKGTAPAMRKIKVDTTIHDLRQFAEAIKVPYDILKSSNPWLLKNTLTIKEAGKVYVLQVPKYIPQRAIATDKPVSTDTSDVLSSKELDRLKSVLKSSG